MKTVSSLKSARLRSKKCRIVRRRGVVYVIDKSNPRLKTKQG
jgi:large subunit ribosomal protein L36